VTTRSSRSWSPVPRNFTQTDAAGMKPGDQPKGISSHARSVLVPEGLTVLEYFINTRGLEGLATLHCYRRLP